MRNILMLVLAAYGTMQAGAAFAQSHAEIAQYYLDLAGPVPEGVDASMINRGRLLFEDTFEGGKSGINSCTNCHGSNPRDVGETRAGKKILPMAVSVTPERYTDLEKVEKWFGRNCRSVMGRDCNGREKSDFIQYMLSQ